MDTLPLPPRPNLEQYQKRAKELVKAAQSARLAAIREWADEWIHSLAKSLGEDVPRSPRSALDRSMARLQQRISEQVRQTRARNKAFSLADAQFLIGSAHGFSSWRDFAAHIDPSKADDGARSLFEKAVDAVVAGDLATLRQLVRDEPALIRMRSAREHHATLLHYVAANGVENFRQKTPKNAVDVARFLLESGSEVDALADTYGSDWWQTTMNLLVSSAHPAIAGLMSPLVDVLADFGAAVNGLRDDESPILTALDFGYVGAAETLAKRGARVDSAATSAALGRLDAVREMVLDANTLKGGTPLLGPPWRRMPNDARPHIQLALVWACKFGRADVAEFLLDRGVDPRSKDGYDMTAIHWAAGAGLLGVVDRLIAAGVPLEAENTWGGTVLNSTLHFVVHSPVKDVDYSLVVERLLRAGADVSVVESEPTGNAGVDEVIRRHRAPGRGR